MNMAYIMRGVPGSGKSTVARKLAGETGVIHSTDDLFMVDGAYCFERDKLREHHDRNYKAFCRSIDTGVETVICDNTNTRLWHYERYVTYAEKEGYIVAIVTMPHPDPKVAAERNHHDVSEHDIRIMINSWEN